MKLLLLSTQEIALAEVATNTFVYVSSFQILHYKVNHTRAGTHYRQSISVTPASPNCPAIDIQYIVTECEIISKVVTKINLTHTGSPLLLPPFSLEDNCFIMLW